MKDQIIWYNFERCKSGGVVLVVFYRQYHNEIYMRQVTGSKSCDIVAWAT